VVPTAEQFDVVVIGGGPGGYAAALYGAAAGMQVAVIERDKVGGTCLHRGCIPAKEFLETASVFRHVGEADAFGVKAGEPSIDFSVSQARKQKVVEQMFNGLSGLMKRRKITVVHGTGTLHPHRTVKVDDGSELKGNHVILAAGSVPKTIPGFDIDGKVVVTSDEFLAWDRLPGSAAVIGAGPIGCEFGSTLIDLGVQVTLLEALPKILPGCDADVADVVVRAFKKRGIDIRTGVKVNGHTPSNGGTAIHIEGQDDVEVDVVVVAVGRRPRTEELVAEGTAVEIDDRGFVRVDDYLRTPEDGVYAVGDVIAVTGNPLHPQLAHVGFAEGIVAIKHMLGEAVVPVDYTRVPWCIYSHPEVAFAGLSEQDAKDAGLDVVTTKHRYAGNGRAVIIGDTDGLVKMIATKDASGRAGQVVGVHMVGPWVTEQLGQAYLAVNWEASVEEIAQFIQPHPTLSEMFGESALSLTGRGLHG
jgi:dihydrolipoamide dehydrogenase